MLKDYKGATIEIGLDGTIQGKLSGKFLCVVKFPCGWGGKLSTKSTKECLREAMNFIDYIDAACGSGADNDTIMCAAKKYKPKKQEA